MIPIENRKCSIISGPRLILNDDMIKVLYFKLQNLGTSGESQPLGRRMARACTKAGSMPRQMQKPEEFCLHTGVYLGKSSYTENNRPMGKRKRSMPS